MVRKNDAESGRNHISPPPEAWAPATKSVQRILAPVERFLHIEASSGIVLMLTAGAALFLANSPWRAAYEALWHIPIGLSLGGHEFERDLHFWINDGLMTIFFFVVGLEIRREIHAGELSELRRAALPLAAAVGGMVAPALIYVSLNFGRESSAGWAIPMATDIAFAVGVLALLGKRVAPALRILLLALAVIDDVGAIIVIALFYSGGVSLMGFGIIALGLALTFGLQLVGVRSPWSYVGPGALVWAGAYVGGIHPTLAGVILGFMTPVRAWYGRDLFLDQIESSLRALRPEPGKEANRHELVAHLDELRTANREALSPVDRLQHRLHPWVAFGVMPLFAFANAGVPLGQVRFEGDSVFVFFGIALGLVVGKAVGILGLSWVTARMGLTALPGGVEWRHVSVVGMVGGIGFTMALFIAQLAFEQGPFLETSKLAILFGSAAAGVISMLAGYRLLKTGAVAGSAASDTEAETSTEL